MTNKLKAMTLLAMLLVFGAVFTLQGGEIPKSIVLVISDGTGIGQHSLSYYENDRYSPAKFEHVGLMTTHTAHAGKITDSAAGATAMGTGTKTYRGAIAVDVDKQPLKTVLEHAQDKGMATGLVATSTITNATPAAFASHVDSRGNLAEIARQLAEAQVTVLFGGGREHFLSKEKDGVQDSDLFEQMSSRGVQIVTTLEEPYDVDRPIIGLFADGGLPPAHKDRSPTTAEMARRALDILGSDPDGFFLMVEESQVDWGSHDHNAEWVQAEMASLNDVIDSLLVYQEQHPETLVVLVADHETGGLAVHEKTLGARYKPDWTTNFHTGSMVPIFATGPGSDVFDAVVDNTFIGQTLIDYILAR
jgi:alkaline phosphatase